MLWVRVRWVMDVSCTNLYIRVYTTFLASRAFKHSNILFVMRSAKHIYVDMYAYCEIFNTFVTIK